MRPGLACRSPRVVRGDRPGWLLGASWPSHPAGGGVGSVWGGYPPLRATMGGLGGNTPPLYASPLGMGSPGRLWQGSQEGPGLKLGPGPGSGADSWPGLGSEAGCGLGLGRPSVSGEGPGRFCMGGQGQAPPHDGASHRPLRHRKEGGGGKCRGSASHAAQQLRVCGGVAAAGGLWAPMPIRIAAAFQGSTLQGAHSAPRILHDAP